MCLPGISLLFLSKDDSETVLDGQLYQFAGNLLKIKPRNQPSIKQSSRAEVRENERWVSLMRRVEKKKETFSRRFLSSRELPPDCINKNKSSSNGSASSAYMDGATKRRRIMMQESSNYKRPSKDITVMF